MRPGSGAETAWSADLAAGGTVAATHVRSNLERAYLIGYVLENGVIVEVGTHTALLEKQGRYASLWQRQASGEDEEGVSFRVIEAEGGSAGSIASMTGMPFGAT